MERESVFIWYLVYCLVFRLRADPQQIKQEKLSFFRKFLMEFDFD